MKGQHYLGLFVLLIGGPFVFRWVWPQTRDMPAAISAPVGHGHPHCPGCEKQMASNAERTEIEGYSYAICSESCEKLVRKSPVRYRLFSE